MSILKNKIDFVVLVSVNDANANGDPLNGNRPRTTYDNYGEISDVCIKRKLRNRLQDEGEKIFVQSEDRCDDNCKSLKERADSVLKGLKKDDYVKTACETWIDVRSFGQVFAFDKKEEGVSVGVRGPVSIRHAKSISPIEIVSQQITKSVSGKPSETKSSDTMGMKHRVAFGLYKFCGSINVQLAEKTGFTEEDAQKLKKALATMFVNDASSARPEGSMEVIKVYWWEHDSKIGKYPTATVHRAVNAYLKDESKVPTSIEDYNIEITKLEGLEPEIIDGI